MNRFPDVSKRMATGTVSNFAEHFAAMKVQNAFKANKARKRWAVEKQLMAVRQAERVELRGGTTRGGTTTVTLTAEAAEVDTIVGEAAEAEVAEVDATDTTDYTTLSLKALQIKCQELGLEWRDAGSKKLLLAERVDQARTEKMHAEQDARVTRLVSEANDLSDEPYAKLKEDELTETCTRYGLPTNGGKSALVARLEAFRTGKKSEANNARFQQSLDLAERKLTAKFKVPNTGT